MSSNWVFLFCGFLIACLCMLVHALVSEFRLTRKRRQQRKADVHSMLNLHVTVTSDDKGVCAITLTDDEGQIKHVLWER